jgi:tryptophan halogenase
MNVSDLDKIVVVGAGSAGLITALMLKKTFVTKLVQVVKSEKLGIIGVGESSTEHITRFMNHIGISQYDLIKNCGATLKAGVYFQGFGNEDFMHSVSEPYNRKIYNYNLMYGQLIGYKKKKYNLYPEFFNYGKIPTVAFNNNPWINQYHLDTHKFNQYLIKLCKERGIHIYDKVIEDKDITIDDKGNLNILESNADLYIDCTGFQKVLAKKLNFDWVSYKEKLPLNSAVAFPTEEMKEYNLYTLAKTMDNGWLWRIPTQGRTGNGYVFNKDFTNLNNVEKEIHKLYGNKIKIERSFEFEPGYYKQMWKNNVVVAGLSSSFIEPLEATSIGSTIQQIFILMDYLPSNDKKSANKQYNYLMENLFNFVQLHYKVKKDNTSFWKYVKNDLPTSDYLKEYLTIWKNRLPKNADFEGGWNMFYAENFINILFGLDLFDLEKITQECRLYPFQERFNITKIFRSEKNYEKNCLKISHKEFIKKIVKNKEINPTENNVIY